MNLKEHLKQLERDPDFVAAREKLQPLFGIGNDILRLRLERGWTQGDVARRAGVSVSTISRLEWAMLNPTVATLQKVAEAFGVRLEVRLRGEE